jgi:Ribonuclease G/E
MSESPIAELFISAGPGEWRAAWVEDGDAVELYIERGDTRPPGSVHLGRVVRMAPGLDAALVDIGDERPALLRRRDAADADLTEGARVLVQVRREARADKAPLLTGKIAGPDLPALAERAARLDPPAQLWPTPGLAAALGLRLPAAPARIVADDAAVLAELRGAFSGAEIAQQPTAEWPLDLDAAFAAALTPSVALRGGGSVHIEETRTATFIDVDTGTPEAGSAERAALTVNRAAAALIARHIRLRNLSGPIVVDFVGLDRRDQREQVRQSLAASVARDPATPEVLGWTRLGHLELVRPRRGRSLADAMLAPGSPAKRPLTLAYEALRQLQREARAHPAAKWRLAVAPGIEAALRGPAAPALKALETRLGRQIAIVAEPESAGFDIAAV